MEQCREFLSAGQRVVATLHLPPTGPAPGVVMCHGFTGHRIEAHFLFVKAARALCAAGLAVLRFDFRGSGESEGEFRDLTVSGEIADALAALQFMRAEPAVDADRIALLGLSLGGLVAACAAARAEGVRALVLWSAVADPTAVFAERFAGARDELDRRGYVEHGPYEIGAGFVAELEQIDPCAEVRAYHGPALVTHGSADQSVPVGHADLYLGALPGTDTTKYIVPDADHTFSSVAWEREVIGVTRNWLVERLGVA